MAVLLISRGTMSGGELLATCLTHTAGIRCVTREDLVASVNRHGELATRVTAEIGRAARDYEQFSASRRPYKILMRHALLEYARQDNLAYFGYSGHLLVEGIAHFVRVRLLAPFDLRVKMTMSRLGCSHEVAEEYIRTADEERVRWARFMYGKNIRDPSLYDLCLSIERVSIPTVCSILKRAVEEQELQPTVESIAAMDDEFLATSVLVALVTHPATFSLEMGATAEGGRVRLEGPYLEAALLATTLDIARSVAGVVHVDYQPGYAPAFRLLA